MSPLPSSAAALLGNRSSAEGRALFIWPPWKRKRTASPWSTDAAAAPSGRLKTATVTFRSALAPTSQVEEGGSENPRVLPRLPPGSGRT